MNRIHTPFPGPRIVLGIALLSILSASGCGSDGPVMGRVSGTVTVEGEPLKKGTVTFIATDSQRPNATGAIDSNGYYSLQTTEPGDGAVVGSYKVAISDVDSSALNTAMPGMPAPVAKSAISKTYLDANSSGLTAEVESGSQTKDFDLKKGGKK
ncbi:hypothetical protein P12x_003242 [Tundrisphaera lichenicola]|uniref:hypothetical protein n=1 Tax=Tundrisphaera lichenicola TaxID=2029860 RepID=UPI003EB89781